MRWCRAAYSWPVSLELAWGRQRKGWFPGLAGRPPLGGVAAAHAAMGCYDLQLGNLGTTHQGPDSPSGSRSQELGRPPVAPLPLPLGGCAC